MEVHSTSTQKSAGTDPPAGKRKQKKQGPTTVPKCGAKTRGLNRGFPCNKSAGYGTKHLGIGRCKYHGGCSPIKHGLYSKVVPTAYKASYLAALKAGDYKSMKEHIALLDGVIIPAAFERGTVAGLTDPLAVQLAALETKSKIVKRLEDVEQMQKISFTPTELKQLVMQIVTIVAEYVDAKTLKLIATRMGTAPLVLISSGVADQPEED